MKRWNRRFFLTLFLILFVICGVKVKTAFAANTCTVAFITNEGSSVPSQTITQGSYLKSLPTPVREGYKFTGWYLDPELYMPISAPYYISMLGYDNTLVLFAGWQKLSVVNLTATYDKQTAIVGTLLDKKLIHVTAQYENGNKELLKETDFTVADLKVNNIGSNVFIVSYENMACYFTVVGIQEQFYTVTFVSNGGTIVNPIQKIRTGDCIALPAEPSRSGYTFKGWYQDSAYTLPFTKETPVTRNMVVFAKWKKDEVVVEEVVYELNTTKLYMDKYETQAVYIETYDPDLENYVSYYSSKPSVASVNQDGIVTAKKNGKATIFVLAPDDSELRCSVVVGPEEVSSIKPSATSKKIKKGSSYTIKTKVLPSTASGKKLSYKSSNKKIAVVSTKGKVTAKNKGSCYITVATTDGSNLKKKVKITVY